MNLIKRKIRVETQYTYYTQKGSTNVRAWYACQLKYMHLNKHTIREPNLAIGPCWAWTAASRSSMLCNMRRKLVTFGYNPHEKLDGGLGKGGQELLHSRLLFVLCLQYPRKSRPSPESGSWHDSTEKSKNTEHVFSAGLGWRIKGASQQQQHLTLFLLPFF